MNFEPDYDVYNEAPPEDEDDETNLDELYPTRPEQMIMTGADIERIFGEQVAQLAADLEEIRRVAAKIQRTLEPWNGAAPD